MKHTDCNWFDEEFTRCQAEKIAKDFDRYLMEKLMNTKETEETKECEYCGGSGCPICTPEDFL